MSPEFVPTIRPELLGLKLIFPPVAGVPFTVTTPVTVASLCEVSIDGFPSEQPDVIARTKTANGVMRWGQRRLTIMISIRTEEWMFRERLVEEPAGSGMFDTGKTANL